MGLEPDDHVLGRGIDRGEVIRIVDLSNIEEAELLLSSAYLYDVGGLRYLDLPAIADDVKALSEGSNFLVVYNPGRRGPPSGRARALASSLCSSADPPLPPPPPQALSARTTNAATSPSQRACFTTVGRIWRSSMPLTPPYGA